MIKRGSYVHGSAAEQIQNDIYKNNTLLNAKKKRKSYYMVKFKAVSAIVIVFMFGFTAMYRYAIITELNYGINSTNREYNELKKDNSRIRMEIDSSMDLKKIQEVAENKLGMNKPDMFQTIHLVVPKSDYTKVAEQYATKSENPSKFGVAINKIGELTRLLF